MTMTQRPEPADVGGLDVLDESRHEQFAGGDEIPISDVDGPGRIVTWQRIVAVVLFLAFVSSIAYLLATQIGSVEQQPVANDGQPEVPEGTALTGGQVPTETEAVFRGMVLPLSSAGPNDVSSNQARGFEKNREGAALAAVWIPVHLDPVAGPSAFRPTIRQQVIAGERRKVSKATKAQYQALRAQTGTAAGKPIVGVVPGEVLGYRVSEYGSGAATVQVLAGRGSKTNNYRVDLVWQRGDWQVKPVSTSKLVAVGAERGKYESYWEDTP